MVKNLSASAGDARDACSIPGLGWSPGEGNGNPLQYSCLGNPKNRGAWQATAYGVTESQTWLSTYAGIKRYPGRLSLDSLNFMSVCKLWVSTSVLRSSPTQHMGVLYNYACHHWYIWCSGNQSGEIVNRQFPC